MTTMSTFLHPHPAPAWRTITAIGGIAVAFALALIVPGCATTGADPAARAGVQVELAIGVASDAAALVLRNNPEAVPVVRAVADGIDSVLARGHLSPEHVVAFVDALDAHGRLSDDERLLIGHAVMRVHGILQAAYGAEVLSTADPKVATTLTRIRDALRQTLELHAALGPKKETR